MDTPTALYDCLFAQVKSEAIVDQALSGEHWACVGAGAAAGLAMATPGESIPPLLPEGLAGLPLREAAEALRSWNYAEASLGMAAVNAALNTPERVRALDCYLPLEIHYSDDLDFSGKTVGVVGHMRGSARMRAQARKIFTLERAPQPGDYPDAACEYLLPQCDIVLITGSSLINKTLPRLLDLCPQAYTVLTGPSVPLCPELLELGLQRIAGLALTDPEQALKHVRQNFPGNPYRLGLPFVLSR